LGITDRHLNDLAWVIRSPSLISLREDSGVWLSSAWWGEEYHACRPILERVDSEQFLQQFMPLKTRRLGDRFEWLVEQWLQISPNYRCLARNVPIRQNKQTLGEMDFIIQEVATGKVIHLEVAIKFYLCKSDGQSMDDWYGPSLIDRLDLKYAKLKNHQSQLSRFYPDLMPYSIDERWMMIKGRMFYPLKSVQKPAFFSADHLTGTWLYQHQISGDQNLYAIEKQDWLATIELDQHPRKLERFDANADLKYPKCLVELEDGREVSRKFVVPDTHW